MSFYPPGYSLPEKEKSERLVSDYMKLQEEAEYKIRILMAPIIGFQTWTGQGKNSLPHRARTYQEAVNLPSRDGQIQEFHAFIVWDYQISMVRLLNVTQQQIKEPIYNQTCDDDWADPTKYDIVIKRVGLSKEDTKYSVTFKLPKPMDIEIVKAFKAVKIDAQKYFEGGHPIVRDKDENEASEMVKTITDAETDDVTSDIPF